MVSYTEQDLGQFVRGYVEAVLFFEQLPEAEEGEEWEEGESYWDAGFRFESVDAASIERIRTASIAVLEEGAHLIPGGRLITEFTAMSHAGHDAAMSAQRILGGFGQDRWHQPVGEMLEAIVIQHMGWDLEPWKSVVYIGRD